MEKIKRFGDMKSISLPMTKIYHEGVSTTSRTESVEMFVLSYVN
jgi:hypothetical protein